jgi:hypothetical protein
LALSSEGNFLAATTQDGRVNVYDTTKINEDVKAAQTLAQFETKGSFGTCVDIVRYFWERTVFVIMLTPSSPPMAR